MRAQIRANMDRWRWLARDLGTIYLITNVPEYQLRLTVGDKIIRTYRTIVGKPGRTATPQLAETVEGVAFAEIEPLGERVGARNDRFGEDRRDRPDDAKSGHAAEEEAQHIADREADSLLVSLADEADSPGLQ